MEPRDGGESARLAELSREELVGELTRLLEAYRELKGRHDQAAEQARLTHELEVHQVELEMQNRELREAHQAIELSRARFARLYDFAPVTYLTLDAKGLILDLNLTGATLFGLERGSLTGKPLVAIATFEDSNGFFRHLHRTLADGRATSDLAFTVNGRRFQMQAVSAREGAPGSAVTVVTALVDVGERKRAEELVRAAHVSEQRLRAGLERLGRAHMAISEALTHMPEHALDVVLEAIVEQARHLADCDFAALGIGGAADRPFDRWVQSGVSREQVAAIGRNPRPVGLLGLVSRQQAVLRSPNLAEDPRFVGFPPGHPRMTSFLGVPVRHRDVMVGSLYLANKRNAPNFDDDDERLMVLLAERATIAIEAARATSVVRDARTTAEAATQLLAKVGHSLTQLGELSGIPRLLTDAAVDHLGADASAVLALIPDGELEVVASRNLPETLGRFRADPEGIGAGLVSHLAEACGTSFAHGRALPLASGQDLYAVWVLLFAREVVLGEERLRLAAGLVDLAATAFADVHREAQLDAARAAIARTEKIRTLGQLAAGVSHDLKNVLSPLFMQVELLERTLPAGAKQGRAAVSRMQRLLKRGLDTVDRLRAFGRQEPTPGEPVDLNEVVHECLGLSAERRQRARGKIELRVERGEPPSVVAEPSELVTSILNLIMNAFDVLPERGGLVTVRTGEDAGGGWIEVEDDGPGIPPELQRRIFEPSFSTKGKEGTGLGLAMVYAFAQRHGGRVTVDSPPNKGARFRIWLPRA